MKVRYFAIVSLLIISSLLLGACSAQATPTPEVVVEEPVSEPVPTKVVVEEPEPASEADLDAAYTAFLVGMEKYNTISPESLNEMLAEAPPYILDVREIGELEEKGHIEGAINIPLRQVLEDPSVLPAFDETIVSYCGSGWRCTIALTALEGLGYEEVLGLKGGSFTGWVDAGYPFVEGAAPAPVVLDVVSPDPALLAVFDETLANVPDGFGVVTADDLNVEIAENPDLVLIDVRTEGEVEEKGMIDAPNVIHIPLEDFIAMKGDWPVDKDAPIVVYCGSGHRSTIAMTMLWSYGYEDVRSLKGGFGGWSEAGYPVAGGMQNVDLDTAFATFLADMEKYNTIGLDSLNEMLAESPPYILDVREVSELEEKGHIEGAVNIPLREVLNNPELLPAFDETIVSYCGSGWRCTIALALLEGLGYEDVLGLKTGSFSGWVEAGYPFVEGAAPEAEVLDAIDPDPALLALLNKTFENVPEGYGVITAENLNSAIAENPDLVLIDVRTKGEVDEKGMIDAPNVIHIPLEQFIEMKDQWPEDLETPIAVYCGSGHRSTIAMAILWAYGYEDVHSLKGGFGGWAEAGYPVAGGAAGLDTAYSIFLADMEKYNTISPELLNEMMAESPPYILDVREYAELEEKGHIEGAVNIPLRQVLNNPELLPAFDETIVSYCGSGWRCTIALALLEGLGYEDVLGLKAGSFAGWIEAGYPFVEGAAPEPEVLDVVTPDPALLAVFSETFENVPEGFGVITAENLNTAIAENPDLVLIDVRTAGEVEEKGVIDAPNVIHIPLEEFIAMKGEWPVDKDTPSVIYCGSGHRSTIAMAMMWSYGYTDVHSLKGGFGGWTEAGYPIAKYEAVES